MTGNTKTTIKIGVDKPEWLPARFFLAARIVTGSVLGLIAAAYGTAVAVTLESIFVGDGARVGELATLFIGGWVVKETLKRIAVRKVEEVPQILPPKIVPAAKAEA